MLQLKKKTFVTGHRCVISGIGFVYRIPQPKYSSINK